MNKPPFFARNAFRILLIAVFLMPVALRGARVALEKNKNDVKAWLPEGFKETKELEWFRDYFLGEQFVVISWEGCTLDDPRVEMLARKLVPARNALSPPTPQSKFFKRVTTGPRVLAEMTDPDGPLKLSMKEATQRLTGTLIGQDGKSTCVVATLTAQAHDNLRAGLGNARPLTKILMDRKDGLLYQIAGSDCAIEKYDIRMGGPPVDNVAIDDEGEITLLRLVGLSALVGLGLSYYCFRSKRVTAMVFCCGVYGAAASLCIVYVTGGQVDAVLMSMPSLIYVLGLSGATHLVNYYKDAARESGVEGAAGMALRHGWAPCTLAALTTALGLGSLFTSEVIPIRKFGSYSALGVMFTLVILFCLLPALLQLWPLPRKSNTPSSMVHHSRWYYRFMAIGDWIIARNGRVALVCAAFMVLLAFGLFRIQTTVQLLKLFDGNADIIQDYTWLEQHLGNLVPMEVVVRVDPTRMRDSNDPILSEDGHYRLTFLERMELVGHIQKNIENMPEVGRALSMNTFAPVLPEQGGNFASFAERSGFNAALQSHRDKFLAEDYYRVADNGEELLRVSARLAALGDVDYGRFVDDIRGVVRPVLAAYRERDRIISKLASEGGSLRGKRVCVVGVPRSKAPQREQAAAESSSKKALPPTPREILAGTLVDLLRVAGVKVTSIYKAAEGFQPKNYLVAGDDNPKAAKFFGTFDLIFVAADHPSVAHRYITRHAREVHDARNFDPQSIDIQEEIASGLSPVYTGVVPLVYKAQRELLSGLVTSILLAFVLICLVMMLILRSPSAGLVAMIPNVFPVVVIFGFMGWANILIDIGTMMTASVAMGVAVDDTVHFLTWFRRGLGSGLDRRGAVRLAYERCATAMAQTTIIGGLGLGVFALSTFTPTQRFGYLMLLLLTAALVGDLIFLPALLVGPLGRLFGAPKVKKPSATLPPGTHADPPASSQVPTPHYWPQRREAGTPHSARIDAPRL